MTCRLATLVMLVTGGQGGRQHFLQEPASVTAVAGERVVLPCSVQHKEGLLQWTKDGFGLGTSRDLPGYPSYSMEGGDPVRQWDLVLERVTLDDDAVFQCQVGAGATSPSIRSQPATVTVMVPPGQPTLAKGDVPRPERGETELEVEAEEGEEMVVTCTSEGGRPAGEITWRDEVGQLLLTDTDTSTHKMEDKSWRTVSTIRMKTSYSDRERTIFCHVTSHISAEPLQAMVRLRMKYRPRVNLNIGDPIKEGGNLATTCEVEAFPPPFGFKWYLDGVTIPGAEGKSIVLEELARVNEGAKLECEAVNLEGTGKAEAFLSVHYGAEIKESPKTVRARVGEQVSFQCKAAANPTPTYKWTRVGSDLSVGNSHILSLTSSNITMGQYVCHALVEGFPPTSSAPASLFLVSKPRILSPKVQTGRAGSEARLECRVTTTGSNNLITWHRHGSILSGQEPRIKMTFKEGETEHISQLIIANAGKEDFGTYGCKAANEVGVAYIPLELESEGFTLGGNEILYIIIGGFALATLALMAVLCGILYQRRKRSNLKYLRAVKQEKLARGIETENSSKATSLQRRDGAQLPCPQPDLIQPLNRPPAQPPNDHTEDSESEEELARQTYYYSPQKKPFSIDRFLHSPATPTMEVHQSIGACHDCKVFKSSGLEEEDQFLTLLPTAAEAIV